MAGDTQVLVQIHHRLECEVSRMMCICAHNVTTGSLLLSCNHESNNIGVAQIYQNHTHVVSQ